jgi:hypothetical protein
MRQRYAFLSFLVVFQTLLLAQDNAGGTNMNVLYRNEISGKIYANTRGYGLLFRQGKHITAKIRSYYEIDIQTLTHHKEYTVSGSSDERRRYVYGKLNQVWLLRGAFGLQNVLFQKGDQKAVEIRYSYSLGPVFAFAKPYYVEVYKYGNIKESVLFDTESYTTDQVVGRAPFSEGFSEMKVYPGISGKFNLSFEYAPYTNLIRAIETGINFEFYPKALPIMARNPAENFIITFNIGFVFGKKWF